MILERKTARDCPIVFSCHSQQAATQTRFIALFEKMHSSIAEYHGAKKGEDIHNVFMAAKECASRAGATGIFDLDELHIIFVSLQNKEKWASHSKQMPVQLEKSTGTKEYGLAAHQCKTVVAEMDAVEYMCTRRFTRTDSRKRHMDKGTAS